MMPSLNFSAQLTRMGFGTGLIPDSVVKKLTALGHNVIRTRALGRAHALTILYGENGNLLEYQGASDPRGEGAASGFE